MPEINSKSEYKRILRQLYYERSEINKKIEELQNQYFSKFNTLNCKYYSTQKDRNGDVVLVYCTHPENPDNYEGNCQQKFCPIYGDKDD